MSYTIIFQTKFVNLADGRLLHLSLSGCNNDDAGRTRSEFNGKIYTYEEINTEIDKWVNTKSDYDSFDLRIGSRYCKWSDYGKHLKTMLNRAVTWEELVKSYNAKANIFRGIKYYAPDNTTTMYSEEEAIKLVNDLCWGKIKGSYSRVIDSTNDINEIVKELEKGSKMQFFIASKCK